MKLLYGYILTWPGYDLACGAPGYREQFREKLLSIREFRVDDRGFGSPQNAWERLWLDSPVALHDVTNEGPDSEHRNSDLGGKIRFNYSFLIRVNSKNGTIIIVSTLYNITDAVIDYFNLGNAKNLQRKIVDVQKVSQMLMESEHSKEYSITYFLADVPGYGSSLKSITMYGNDISEAEFLREERKKFSARKIGVRPFDGPFEAGRFNNFGMIQFRIENISIFENFLRYAHQHKLFIE